MNDGSAKSPALTLCGLGLFPPYTATLEVLQALARSDVLFNNVAGTEVREFLSQFCADIRPAAYQAAEDERRWADSILAQVRRGKRVAFVTRGHPLVFGALACELVRRCRRLGIEVRTYGSVSSIDVLLAAMGKGLGDHFQGVQALDRPALEKAPAVNTLQPLIVSFYSGLSGRARIRAFEKSLSRFYPRGHACWMFGPKYDDPPRPVRLGSLAAGYDDIHASLMLYVPARRVPAGR